MSYTFNILDHELSFSQEKVDYMNLKRHFQRLSREAEDEFKKILPEVSDDDGGFLSDIGDAVLTGLSNGLTGLTAWGGLASSFFSDGDYGYFNIFLEERNKYVTEYINAIKATAVNIVNELQEQHVYVDENELIIKALSDSELSDMLNEAGRSIQRKVGENTNTAVNKYYNYYYEQEKNEKYDMQNSTAEKSAIYDAIVEPLNQCFLRIVGSTYGDKYYNDDANGDGNTIHIAQKCAKKVFQRSEIQKALADGLWQDVYSFFRIKRTLLEENNLGSFEIVTADESDRAHSLYKLFTSKDIPEEDEKKMMAEAIVCNPGYTQCYYAILDKYYDPDGELQRLASLMGVNIATHIENKLLVMYNQADTGTLESTLEIKAAIIEEQKKYALETSQALTAATERQYFIELMNKAAEMDCDAVVNEWQSVKDGNNTFVGDKREFITDDQCIDILSRRFRKIHAANYHDIIRDLGLTDDTSEGDKNYGFYEEGENYILFEDICREATGFEINRDEDLINQNYGDETLASGEVMLGYFHYTRQLDVIGDGKSMIITNKRIYTTKEKFTSISDISGCKPMKKLLLNYVVFEKKDGSTPIQLPVSKEIMISAADMINRLISALDGREYSEISEIEKSKTTAVINDTVSAAGKQISDKFGKAKKGLKSLFK